MTTPNGPILFNNSTGSDTAASGLGPATAISGSAAAHTNNVATTTIILTNSPDLSGVQAGDLLWLKTSSGRQFSIIASVDDGADTVTVDDSFTIDSASAVDYAIGGKRATLDNADSRTLFANWKSGWGVEVEYTGTNYTLTSALPLTQNVNNGHFPLVGTGAGMVVIEQTANVPCLNTASGSGACFWNLENIKLINSNATKTNAIGFFKSGGIFGGLIARNCVFGDSVNQLLYAAQITTSGGNLGIQLFDCEIKNCTSDGLQANGGSVFIFGCYVHDNGDQGLENTNGGAHWRIVDCVIANNVSDGIRFNGSSEPLIQGCVIHNNGDDGIDFNTAATFATVFNNVISENGGYGIRASAAAEFVRFSDYNAFYNNTSGEISDEDNFPHGANDITLSVNPYIDSANGDFRLNNTTGGGADLKAVGFPTGIGSSTPLNTNIGVDQTEAGGGGGVSNNNIKSIFQSFIQGK